MLEPIKGTVLSITVDVSLKCSRMRIVGQAAHMNRTHERELLIRWQQGDQAAVEELWQSISPKVSGFVEKLIRRWSKALEAKDVVQEVWTTALERVPSGKYDVDGSGRFWTWFCSVARNMILAKSRCPRPWSLPDWLTAPSTAPVINDFMLDLGRAVQKLPNTAEEPLRRVFCDRYGVEIIHGKAECCGKAGEAETLRLLRDEFGISHDRSWLYRMTTRATERIVREMSSYLDRQEGHEEAE